MPRCKGGRRGGLMVSELNSGSSSLGSSPRQGHCVVLLGKTLSDSIEQYVTKIKSKLGLDCNVATNLYSVIILKTDEAPSTCLLFVQKGGLQMMTQALKVFCFKITAIIWFTFYICVCQNTLRNYFLFPCAVFALEECCESEI